ncbi:GntR family transcriptional regulator [Phytoactinopolyspora endophytica]|uniref:GntR family transcriptional regulator n=1 Tax=Phytoactinopolyspora endophytica TaxID=1642495 RepID=UPI00101DD777|nr:winged helix-turn-helix domain-containing protein [Phytoactinopolyspora endophytica]
MGDDAYAVDLFDADLSGPGYLYLQLADHIHALVCAGTLRPGARLLGERDLAEHYDVSIGTARRATDELRNREVVLTLPAKGTYVHPHPPPITSPGRTRAQRDNPAHGRGAQVITAKKGTKR